MNPRRVFAAVAAAAFATVLAACAPITTTSFTQRGVSLSTYRTFAWERVDTSVPGDPRLDNNQLFHDYLRGAIDRQLIARGYEPTTQQPDVRVHYHASSRQKIHVSGFEPDTERCRECAVEVYDEGTLLIDLTDGRTGALLWRGAAESGLADTVTDQRRMEQTIARVVERIFAALPHRS